MKSKNEDINTDKNVSGHSENGQRIVFQFASITNHCRPQKQLHLSLTLTGNAWFKARALYSAYNLSVVLEFGNQPAAVVGSTAAADGFGLTAVLAVAVLFVTYCIARLLFSNYRVGDLYITQDDQMSRTHQARSIPPIFTGGLHWTATSGLHERRRRQFVDRSGGIQRLPNWKIKLEGGPMQS